jgi:hypothetical protein
MHESLTPLSLLEKLNPSGPAKAMRGPLKLAGFIGAFGGFLFAYQKSSRKFT